MGSVAWFLNLGGEEALGGRPAPSSRRLAEIAAASKLPRPGDVVLPFAHTIANEEHRPPRAARAWVQTPEAETRLRGAGFCVEPLGRGVARRVLSRRFAHELGPTLDGQAFVHTEADLRAALRARPEVARWLVKRAYSCSGRGRRVVDAGSLRDEDLSFAHELGAAGAVVEPLVQVELELALHGYVERDGSVSLGALTVQEVSARGVWLGTRLASQGEVEAAWHRALEHHGARSGEALAAAGYRGPFGLDAFAWRDEHGTLRFRPLSELNARYTMGWAVGMPWRPDVPQGAAGLVVGHGVR